MKIKKKREDPNNHKNHGVCIVSLLGSLMRNEDIFIDTKIDDEYMIEPMDKGRKLQLKFQR